LGLGGFRRRPNLVELLHDGGHLTPHVWPWAAGEVGPLKELLQTVSGITWNPVGTKGHRVTRKIKEFLSQVRLTPCQQVRGTDQQARPLPPGCPGLLVTGLAVLLGSFMRPSLRLCHR
jgi:hypothetical protein